MPQSPSLCHRTQVFASALAAMMERKGVNQVQLRAATGIAVSRINNYLHGNYRTVRPDHLRRLVEVVTSTAEERAALIRAYLLDLLPEVLQSAIRVEVVRTNVKPGRPPCPEKSLLPRGASAAIQALETMSLKSAKARSRVEWFSAILREVHQA